MFKSAKLLKKGIAVIPKRSLAFSLDQMSAVSSIMKMVKENPQAMASLMKVHELAKKKGIKMSMDDLKDMTSLKQAGSKMVEDTEIKEALEEARRVLDSSKMDKEELHRIQKNFADAMAAGEKE